MTKPSDFSPDRVLEMRSPSGAGTRNVQAFVWRMRIIGAVLLIAGWIVISTPDFGSPEMLVDTAVLGLLAAYAFVSAAYTRRFSMNMERELRLGLLVHNMELQNMAMQDDLTQLFNRRYFFDRLERELETARAFNRPLSVIVADLDMMKSVNDTYGHRIGDQLLTAFGKFLLETTRTSDVPARIGGDEFAIILPNCAEEAATNLLGRLRQKLEASDMFRETDAAMSLHVAASFGLAGCPYSGQTADDIMQAADAAMYADKHAHHQAAAAATNGNGAARQGAPKTASDAA